MDTTAAVHPTDETLYSRGLGTLDDAMAESVDRHVEGCADCQRRMAAMPSDNVLGRLGAAQGQPGSAGHCVSSLDGLSMLDDGANQIPPPPADSLPPGLAGHKDYEVIRELGHGGMGTVYLAKNRLMGRHEVLKVVSKHMINRPAALERFLSEIRHAARLHHTNIVTAYSATHVGESIVFAMEYVEGLDLSKLVKAKGPLPVTNACHYIHQAALGLQHASEVGMVHRDIKPSNLMLAKQGNRAVVKVLDFGLAKVRSEGAVDGSLTHDGQFLGTPEYVAPEQISNARHADIRADIYSLGCTFYYLLTGAPPFQASSLYDLLQAHHSMDALPLNLARPAVPSELAALVAKMMAKEPERRFQAPKDVAQALLPFSKKGMVGNTPAMGPAPEFSRPGMTDEAGSPARKLAAAAQQATAPMAAPSEPAYGPVSDRSRAESPWEGLSRFKESESPATPANPTKSPARPPRWLWPLATAGLLPLGLALGWAAIVAFKRPDGASEVVNPPIHVAVVTQPVANDSAGDRLDDRKVDKRALPKSVPDPTLSESDDEDASDGTVEDPASAFAAERAMTTSDPPSPATVIALPAVVGKAARKAEFRPLFNGKNLDGWKHDPKQRGNWRVVNHILVGGSGSAPSHLYTKRDDFKDFHLRVEARFNKSGGGGVFLRCPFGARLPEDNPKWPDGYEVMINNSRVIRNNTGGIYPGVGTNVFVTELRKVHFGEWFTLDVIVDGNAIAVLVNGNSSGYHLDRKQLFSTGHIALQQYSPNTVVEFRKIDIKELSPIDHNDPKEFQRIRMGRVTRVAFSPNGLDILSGAYPNEHSIQKGGTHWFSGGAGTLRSFELATGRTRATMGGVGWPVMALAVSSDGRYAASCAGATSRQPILIWDLESGKRVHKLIAKDASNKLLCTALSFSQDGTRIMAACTGGAVLTWDLATEQERSPMALQAGPIRQHEFPGATFGSDARHLITGRFGGPVELWDPESGRKLQTFVGHVREVRSVANSADGRFVLAGGIDKTVRLWDVASGKELMRVTSRDGPVRCIALSPDSRRALSADVYGLIHLWDLASGKEVCRMEGHTMAVNSVAFSPDGRRAVSGSDDRTVRLWQLPE